MLQTKLELNPNISAIKLMNDLLKQDPIKYKKSQLRTLQRRVAKWRKQRLQRNKKKKINELTGERHQVVIRHPNRATRRHLNRATKTL